MSEILRQPNQNELDQIYLMGIDVWSDNSSEADYLSLCRSSPKYKKGTWYVLEKDGKLVCSLIIYKLGQNQFGIGSIATPKTIRNNGYASILINKIVNKLEEEGSNTMIFLYSDISPEFYEKFGFQRLPFEIQRYKTTTCMVRGKNAFTYLTDKSATPEYF